MLLLLVMTTVLMITASLLTSQLQRPNLHPGSCYTVNTAAKTNTEKLAQFHKPQIINEINVFRKLNCIVMPYLNQHHLKLPSSKYYHFR